MKAKKQLGQNFLKSKAAIAKIVEVGKVSADDIVLEIGPGKAALTSALLERAGRVIAVEKDRDLSEELEKKFAKEISQKKLTLVRGDILDFDPDQATEGGAYKIIANIPYNITGAILKKFLSARHQPSDMILMVQKEVAERIMARNGRESILSISVKAYGAPSIVMKVGAEYFSPRPKVDSAVIAIRGISRIFFEKNGISEETFWQAVKTGFAHKRKRLLGNLKPLIGKKTGDFGEFGDKRAEELALEDWAGIVRML